MKKLIASLFAIIAFVTAHAQKLPNVQQKSLRAPDNVKVDGKTNEWNSFAAYNYATGIYYTIANDNDNLYLAIQAKDANVLSKITQRGIVLEIDPSGKKNASNVVSVQYPVFELQYKNKPYIRFSNASGLTADQRREMLANPDSMRAMANKKIKANDKYIRTSGMSDVDTLLSVYNEKDIVARQGFEKWELYNYELAIPLKYLNLRGSDAKFAYHIILKGMSVDIDSGLKMTKQPDGNMAISMAPGAVTIQNKDMPAVIATTDFWGDYTLAK
ncbi:hypothetical protein [Mucilaginibacter auburnensis]|uniref:S9 family peptidase n=1 Tax=Mucilaginibacter auburnensis TaxID=1457233 RepID=A0A2H9VUC4_9SPHI|nr:hypothetical protein [Mucilaginibacter auburnensis]PJJ84399.1 hypothetical protein CLV57_1410 [Mucilaginibacter auburnensis]